MPLSFCNYMRKHQDIVADDCTLLLFPAFYGLPELAIGSLSPRLRWSAQRADLSEQTRQPHSTPTHGTKHHQSAGTSCVPKHNLFLALLSTHLLGRGWTLPVVLSQKCSALVCFPTAPDATGGKTQLGREASAEAVRDDWETREDTETRDKGRKDYLTLPLSPPAAAATGSPSSLLVSPPLLTRTGLLALGEAVRHAVSSGPPRVN